MSATVLPSAMTAADVAAELQIDERQFFMRRPRLQREHGFPRALPGCLLRWSRAQVLAWINAGGEMPDDEPPTIERPRLVVDNARDLLTARYVEARR